MILHLWVIVYIAGVYLRPSELVPALADVPVMDILAAAGLLLGLISVAVRPRKFWNQPHDLFFLGYYAILVLSNPLNGFFGGGVVAFTQFSTVAVLYLLIRLGASTAQQVRRMATALVLLTLFLAVNGLMQIYTGVGIGGVTATETREGARIVGTGIFNDPNDLGMAMVTVVPLVLSVVLGRTRLIAKIFGFAALAVLLLACYYTNSRGTIIGLGVVFSIFAFRRFGLFTAATLSAVGLAAIILFGPSRTSQIGSEDSSSQGRVQAWAAAVSMARESPFWGVGYGQFMEHHERVAHNSLMHALGELGIVGAVMFVGMFHSYFMGLRPALREPDGPPEEPPNGRRGSAHRRGSDDRRPTRRNGSPAAALNGRLRKAPEAALEADVAATRDANRRLARDLMDCGIGMLTCAAFLSRQYTVTLFIPLALSASFAAATAPPRAEPDAAAALTRVVSVPALTVVLVVMFWVGVKVLVRY